MKRHADKAQMESDDVAALKVFSTGDNAIRARKTKIDDLSVFVPAHNNGWLDLAGAENLYKRFVFLCALLNLEHSSSSHVVYPPTKHVTVIQTRIRGSREHSLSLTKTARKM
jgi:hypothetical protein